MFLVFLDAFFFFCCLSRHLTVLWFWVGRSDNMLNQKGPQTVILFIGGSSLLRALLLISEIHQVHIELIRERETDS